MPRFFQMLMLEHLDKLSENAARAISNIKFDKVVVWDGGQGKDGKNATSGFLNGLAGALPPVMHMMKDIAGVEMPEAFGKLIGDDGAPEEAEPAAEDAEAEQSEA